MVRPRIIPRDAENAKVLEIGRVKYAKYRDKRLAQKKVYYSTERGRAAQKRRSKKKAEEAKTNEEARKKLKARDTLQKAVRRGKVKKPPACEVCKVETPREHLEGHHEDYDKPLEVIWMCAGCHSQLHFGEDISRNHNCPVGTSASRDAVTTSGPEHKETQPMP